MNRTDRFWIEMQNNDATWSLIATKPIERAAMLTAKKIENQGYRARIIDKKPITIILPNVIPEWKEAIDCTECGCKGIDHRSSDGMCPPTTGFGQAVNIPDINLLKQDYWAADILYWQQSTTFNARY